MNVSYIKQSKLCHILEDLMSKNADLPDFNGLCMGFSVQILERLFGADLPTSLNKERYACCDRHRYSYGEAIGILPLTRAEKNIRL